MLEAGGRRAHLDATERELVGADFVIGEAVIELKILEEDGLNNIERQNKLVALFSERQGGRPVIVVDPSFLDAEQIKRYKNLMRTPIKTIVAHAKKQLAQSRTEIPETTCSVLMVVNDSFTALPHDELVAMVADRVRADTSKIDAVVVAGCYLHGDGFEAFANFPIDLVEIHPDAPFRSFEVLKAAWDAMAEAIMTEAIKVGGGEKTPEEDKVFERDGVFYIRPARPIGGRSQFYPHGRARRDSGSDEPWGPVARVFPGLSKQEWGRLRPIMIDPDGHFKTYDDWLRYEEFALADHEPLRPLVRTPVTRGGFEAWRRRNQRDASILSLSAFAQKHFETQIRHVIDGAREHGPRDPFPRWSVLLITEEIGQDRAHDVSRIAFVEKQRGADPTAQDLVGDQRLPHERALVLAAAHALALGTDTVLWRRRDVLTWR